MAPMLGRRLLESEPLSTLKSKRQTFSDRDRKHPRVFQAKHVICFCPIGITKENDILMGEYLLISLSLMRKGVLIDEIKGNHMVDAKYKCNNRRCLHGPL